MSYVFKTLSDTDVIVNSYELYKTWDIDLLQSQSLGIQYLYGQYYTGSISSSSLELRTNGILARSVFSSIQRLYYPNILTGVYPVHIPTNLFDQRNLYNAVDVISIPQKIYGTRIKPGSVVITGEHGSIGSISLKDDGYGNIISLYPTPSSISTSVSGSSYTGSLVYAGEFADSKSLHFDTRQWFGLSSNVPSNKNTIINCWSILPYDVVLNGVYKKEVPPCFISYFDQCGTSGSTPLYSHILLRPSRANVFSSDILNPKQHEEFTIVFSLMITGSSQNQNIIDKGRYRTDIINHSPSQRTYAVANQPSVVLTPGQHSHYPYNITLLPSRRISFSRSDGMTVTTVTSSVALNDYELTYVVCQKSGGMLRIDVNGSPSSVIDRTKYDVHNNADVMIGGDGIYNPPLKFGSIQTFAYYNRAVSDYEITEILSSTARNSVRVGNINYEQGQIIVSDPSLYGILNPTSCSLLNLQFESTKPMTQIEAICTITDADCNVTQNRSVRHSSSIGTARDFVTHSNFIPYISNVGLYNDVGQLLMVGKPTNPVPKIPGIDITFVLKTHI